jgi:5-methylcytosine-specific restriction endonuclease McrA
MADRICLHCGAPFAQTGPGRPRSWCFTCLPPYGDAVASEYMRTAVALNAYAKTGAHVMGCCGRIDHRSPIGPRLSEVGPEVRSCIHCGADFPAKQGKHKACSAACIKAAWRKTETGKAYKKRHANNNRVSQRERIAVRDKHRCALCGKRVDMRISFPDPMCATIDHVVPRARGGGDEDANLQLAHFVCNASKNDGYVAGGEQMRLI